MNKEWFVFKGTHHLGPFSVEEMAEFYQTKEIIASTLVWKEGTQKWEPISKVGTFTFLFHPELAKTISAKTEIELPKPMPKIPVAKPAKPIKDEASPPPLPHIPTLPKAPIEAQDDTLFDDDLPPPIPLDAIIDPTGVNKIRFQQAQKKSQLSKYFLALTAALFMMIVAWFVTNEKDAGIQMRIKGIMPVYLEKLEMTATKNTPNFEVDMALSLDSLNLWASTNKSGEINTVIKLTSIPKRVLGTENVVLTVKGELKNHIGKFTRMFLTEGSKFLPGEYQVHVEGRETHFINRHFKKLSTFKFFSSLNKSYSFDGTTLIYPGTPREFEKKMDEYGASIVSEMLKPFQDKLERIRTFESLLNATSQNYLMELEKAKTGKAMASFEGKFIKEISPLLQALVVKASELARDPMFGELEKTNVVAPYREQVLLGKQIGEMASDMITKTQKFKKLTDKDKLDLRSEFDKRARSIKLQIDLNIKKLDEQISKISK